MKKRRAQKKPSDYPLFVFRLNTLNQKERLSEKIDQARSVANATLDDSQKKYCKSELIELALTHGLESIIKGKLRLPS